MQSRKTAFLISTALLIALSFAGTALAQERDGGQRLTVINPTQISVVVQPGPSIAFHPLCPKPIPANTLLVPCQYKTIQKAIDAAQSGQTILVDPGVYSGRGNQALSIILKTLTLTCKGKPGDCILDAKGNSQILKVISNSSRIEGFAFVNGRVSGASGGAVELNNAGATFDQCFFDNNEAAGSARTGGAFYVVGGTTNTVSNSLLTNNRADYGGAVSVTLDGHLVLRNTTIADNVSDATFPSGGAIFTSPQISNSRVTLLNSIVWNNLPAANQIDDSSGMSTASYTLVPADELAAFSGPGNLSQDPLFVDPANGDYHLGSIFPISPAIEAGDPAYVPFGGERDLDDSCRVVCTDIDMGAYEANICKKSSSHSPTDVPQAIPDADPLGTTSTVFVSPFGTIDNAYGIFVDLDHPDEKQLKLTLVHPDGSQEVLCGGFILCSPGAFYYVRNAFLGKQIHGNWQFIVEDKVLGLVGTLEDWRLDLEYSLPTCPL